MPRNGSGGFGLPVNSWNPATNAVAATAADYQALINDVAAAIQQSISADGQTPITGNLNMGGFKLSNMAAGSATGESLRFEQLFSQGNPSSIASAATVDIGAINSVAVEITGTTGITSLGTAYNGPRFTRFTGILTLTHAVPAMNLVGAANITTAAGDVAIWYPNAALNGWNMIGYQRATGVPASAGQNSDITSLGNNSSQIYSAGGTPTAYTITPSPAYTAYAAGQSFVVKFIGASGASPTLQINGIATPPNLVRLNSDGTFSNLAAGAIPINHHSRVTLISTTQAWVETLPRSLLLTAQATTSGTSFDFTGIPSWATKLTVMYNNISTNGTSPFLLQIGTGLVATTGYLSGAWARAGESVDTTGFLLVSAAAAGMGSSGHNTLTHSGSNLWVSSGILSRTGTGGDGFGFTNSGTKTTSGVLDRVRLTTAGGTDAFDAGSFNILVEG